LLANDLIDEINLFTLPIVLGNGTRLFGEGVKPAAFRLVDDKVTRTGVSIARYQRAGDVVTAILPWTHQRQRKSRAASG
jgi:dihydrofolate reductase